MAPEERDTGGNRVGSTRKVSIMPEERAENRSGLENEMVVGIAFGAIGRCR
jgi:hypothetical protein